MGISISLLLIAAGAILRFAVSADASGINLETTGLILMIIGAIGLVISLVFWGSWGGFSRRTMETRETSVGDAQATPVVTQTVDETRTR